MALAVVLAALAVATAQELKEFYADYLETPSDGPKLTAVEERIVQLTNEFRQEQGLETLQTNPRLQKAAAYFAAYMARTNKYGHGADGNRPAERVAAYDYNYCIVAENIAFQMKSTGFETQELARKFFQGWKDSPGHRKNMLRDYVTETGVAIGHGPNSDRYFAVQLFARPKSAAIEFQVRNRTGETVEYTVSTTADDDSGKSRTFQLPPRATMYHTRCRPAEINWGWTEKADELKASNRNAYTVTESADGYEVNSERVEQTESERS